MSKVLLHVGCANRYYPGFINTDMRTEWKGKKHKLDIVMDVSKPWPFKDGEVDGIVGMHVFQQVDWRGLLVAFSEAHRVLKPGGVLRMGCPMVEIKDRSLGYLLGWNNINLFSFDLLKSVLVYRMGFKTFDKKEFGQSAMPELATVDNRKDRGTMFLEAIK